MRTNSKWSIAATLATLFAMLALVRSAVIAGPPEKTARVGILVFGSAPLYGHLENALIAGLRERGLVEGKNLVFERRYADGNPARASEFAQELATLNLDAIVTTCTPTTHMVKQATATIPIVMVSVGDPVGQGFVMSLARSGTNVTGTSSQFQDLVPKMLELFHAMVPQAESTAVLVNTLNPVHQGLWREADTAAPSLQMKLLRVEMRGSAGLDEAFDAIAKQHPSALFVLPDDATFNLRARIIEFVNNQRLPSLFGFREFVEDGGLMSYGRNFADSYRQSAAYVDKVVHGVNPATLPIEQPTTFELVINLKAARALGLTVPQSILLRADKVIE